MTRYKITTSPWVIIRQELFAMDGMMQRHTEELEVDIEEDVAGGPQPTTSMEKWEMGKLMTVVPKGVA